jgi:hypothetical protein
MPILVVVVVLGVASQLPVHSADSLRRYFGLAFQLLAILTVVSGLRGKRRLFNRPSLVEAIRLWIQQRPRWGAKPQTILVAGTDSISLNRSREGVDVARSSGGCLR